MSNLKPGVNKKRTIVNYDLDKFCSEFKEGIYSNGIHMIEAWWDYDKGTVLLNDVSHVGHTGMYPIVFHFVILNNYEFIGEV